MTAVPAAPVRTSRFRWFWWVIAVAVVLVTAVGVVTSVSTVIALQNMPRTLVAHYLSALERGHAEEAMRLAGIKANAGDVLLNDKAYAAATDQISSFQLAAPRPQGATVSVDAMIVQGDRKYRESFVVEKAGGLPGLPFWRLGHINTDVVDFAVAGPSGLTFTVGGVAPKSMPLDTAVTLRAFPGSYPVRVTSPNGAYQVWDADVTSIPAGKALKPTEFTAKLSSDGDAEARRAVDAWLDACVASKDPDPADCPFSVTSDDGDVKLSDLRWSLTTRPNITIIPEWTHGGWLVTSDNGSVSASAELSRQSDGATGRGDSGAIAFSYRGVVSFDGPQAVFAPYIGDQGTAG